MISIALDVVLALVVVEAIVLVLVRRRTGRGLPPRRLLTTLAAGFFVMLAFRLHLAAGAGPGGNALVALCLLAALVAHVADLASRWE